MQKLHSTAAINKKLRFTKQTNKKIYKKLSQTHKHLVFVIAVYFFC